ncbi:MAG: MarC family protein [Candidatus Alcyoniella australis]|nr:MarC family protein [Candidatus Alcyoniella australis]
MHELVLFTTTVFMGFFAIMNPLANTPIFLGLTEDLDDRERKIVALKSVLIALLVVGLFSVLGRAVFKMFAITLPAFRVAGGVLVFLVGYHLLNGRESNVQTPHAQDIADSEESKLSVAISPLAVPILAGPGTIATAMNFAAKADALHVGVVLAAFAVMCLITYLSFVFGEELVRYIGKGAIKAIGRLMGLILAVIGTQMLLNGISGAFNLG